MEGASGKTAGQAVGMGGKILSPTFVKADSAYVIWLMVLYLPPMDANRRSELSGKELRTNLPPG